MTVVKHEDLHASFSSSLRICTDMMWLRSDSSIEKAVVGMDKAKVLHPDFATTAAQIQTAPAHYARPPDNPTTRAPTRMFNDRCHLCRLRAVRGVRDL